MKLFCLASTILLTAAAAQAQTLTQSSHAPAPGDVHNTYQCDSVGITPGASGPGAVWNFSNVTTHTNIAKAYTVNVYSAASYSPADVVKFSSQSDIAYYKSTANNLKYHGGSISVSTVVATAIYANPAIRGVYPMSLNTSSTSPISGTLNLTQPLAVSASFTGSSSVVADGTGTLILPGANGTFTNVMRVVSSQTLNFSVQIPPTTGTLAQAIYDYYLVGNKVPMFSITSSTVTNALIGTVTGSVVTINKDYPTTSTVAVGMAENKATPAVVNVFPNPSSSFVTFSADNLPDGSVMIYDVTGKLVDKATLSNKPAVLNVADYSNGLYIYKVINGRGDAVKTGKLTVSH